MSTSSISNQFQNSAVHKPDLTSALQSNGLSSDKAKQVSDEIDNVISSKLAGSTGRPDPKSIRSAVEQQLKTDVEKGTLTQEQADVVTKTLDSIEKQAGGTPPAGGPPGGAPPSGASAGGQQSGASSYNDDSNSSSKTEKDRTVTINGGVKTTVITYTDNSKETKNSYVGDGDKTSSTIKSLVASANKDASEKDQSAAADYLSNTLQNGFVTDTKA